MVCLLYLVSTALALFLPVSIAASFDFQESCNALAGSLQLPNTELQFTEFLSNGTNITLSDYDKTCISTEGSSDFQIIQADLCRVAMLVHTSNASNVTLEAWLPLNWTGRFLSGGVGGLSGCIQYVDLAYGSAFGFATVSHNNGHNGSSGEPFYQHPGVLEDYAYRASLVAARIGKQVTRAFYQRNYTKSYFMGCSGGGRQGFQFAQRFQDEYDGIIAGAPAFNFVNLINWGGWLSTIAGFDTNSTDFVTEDLWNVVHDDILNQCDSLDGAVDGILEDPDLCNPNFETLICSKNITDTTKCLNGAQAARVRQVYQPLYGLNGTLLFPRQQPGAEMLSFYNYLSGVPSLLASDWYRYAVYDPSFNPETLSLEDMAVADAQDPYNISTWDANLTAFQRRGGKILTLHGMEDGVISAEISRLYYHRVAETMSMAPSDLDEFYRFFRVSGMGHCALGSGAYNLGMYAWGGLATSTPTDPDDNVLERIVAWVERGEAPEFIRGTRFVNDTYSLGIDYKRKHCKYPKRNVHIGPENYTDENSWECQI